MQTHITFKNYDGTVKVVLWKSGDPVPVWAKEVGIDTETELITDVERTPPLVVGGIYNPLDQTCYISDWINFPVLFKELCKSDVTLYFANIGFDYFELQCDELKEAVKKNKVVDIFIRAAIKEVGSIGFIRSYSLVDCCKNYLDYKMDKHEEQGEAAARVSFRRNKEVTEEQYIYLSIDCASTCYAGMIMGPQPTECTHTRGAVCLAQIEKNGIPYDPYMFDYCEKLLTAKREVYRQELIQQGFPDPLKKKEETEGQRLERTWKDTLTKWIAAHVSEEYVVPKELPNKATCKRMLIYGLFYLNSEQDKATMCRTMVAALMQAKKTLSRKEEKVLETISQMNEWLDACDTVRKAEVWPLLLETFMLSEVQGKDAGEVLADMELVMEKHPEWFATEEPIKPKAFLQIKLAQLEKEHGGLHFDRTPKAGELKCSKNDAWKLQEYNVNDAFLTSYMNYGHANKYLMSFCNRSYLASDGRVRAKFGIVNTLRSSAAAPNVQQYPSHDHEFPLKNMFKAPEGTVFVSCDYSFGELVALAQNCLTKYGHSVLAEVINADVCPHYYYSSVMLGLIKPEVEKLKDPEYAAYLTKFMKEHVTKEQRQLAKAVNFGRKFMFLVLRDILLLKGNLL